MLRQAELAVETLGMRGVEVSMSFKLFSAAAVG